MKTLLIFNLGGGDLCFRIVDDFLSKEIDKWCKSHKDTDAYGFQEAVSEITGLEDAEGNKKKGVKEHIIKEFFVQSPVIEKKSLEADRVIYFD